MLVDEPIPGPPLTVYRGTAHSLRWRVTRKSRPVSLEGLRVVMHIANEVGENAGIVETLDSDNAEQIAIDEEDPSYFTVFFPSTLTETLGRESYFYSMLLYGGPLGPEVLTLPANFFVKPVIGPVPA
jgi:hypothetical protein